MGQKVAEVFEGLLSAPEEPLPEASPAQATHSKPLPPLPSSEATHSQPLPEASPAQERDAAPEATHATATIRYLLSKKSLVQACQAERRAHQSVVVLRQQPRPLPEACQAERELSRRQSVMPPPPPVLRQQPRPLPEAWQSVMVLARREVGRLHRPREAVALVRSRTTSSKNASTCSGAPSSTSATNPRVCRTNRRTSHSSSDLCQT